MARWPDYVAPVLLGAALLFVMGLGLRASLDPDCVQMQADHNSRMQRSDQTLLRLSSLNSRDQCLFYRERAALMEEKVKPGGCRMGADRGDQRLMVETEARLYHNLVQSCSV